MEQEQDEEGKSGRASSESTERLDRRHARKNRQVIWRNSLPREAPLARSPAREVEPTGGAPGLSLPEKDANGRWVIHDMRELSSVSGPVVLPNGRVYANPELPDPDDVGDLSHEEYENLAEQLNYDPGAFDLADAIRAQNHIMKNGINDFNSGRGCLPGGARLLHCGNK